MPVAAPLALMATLALSPAPPVPDPMLRAISDDAPSERHLTAPGLALPGTFSGSLPTGPGQAMDWHLDLWPDQAFHLLRTAPDGSTEADLGRWHAAPGHRAIVLRGRDALPVVLEIRGDGTLQLPGGAGAAADAEAAGTLAEGPLDPAVLSAPMAGLFRYMADAAVFTECLTGRSYPVAMEGAYIAAERAYLGLEGTAPGAPALAVLDGTLVRRPAMEGRDRTHLVIDRFSRMEERASCEGARPDPALAGTYWRLRAIGGTQIEVATDERREPYLLLHAGPRPAFNATVGCNMIRGGYVHEGGALSFGPAATTMMACPPALERRERALAEALGAVVGWKVSAGMLELADAEGKTVLRAEAAYLP